jgi:hypothetical protein
MFRGTYIYAFDRLVQVFGNKAGVAEDFGVGGNGGSAESAGDAGSESKGQPPVLFNLLLNRFITRHRSATRWSFNLTNPVASDKRFRETGPISIGGQSVGVLV